MYVAGAVAQTIAAIIGSCLTCLFRENSFSNH